MNLPHPVTIATPRPPPMPGCVPNRGMAPAESRKVVVAIPFIRIYHRPWLGRVDHEGFQGLLIRIVDDLQSYIPGSPADDPDHGRTVVLHRPMPPGLVGPTPGRIVG